MKPMRALVAVAAVAVLSSCGGSESEAAGVASLEADDTDVADADADTAADPTTDADPEAQALAFAECMRENGVEMDDPTVDANGNIELGRAGAVGGAAGGDLGDDTREAFDACGEFLEGIALGGGNREFDTTELQDSLLEYAECMRDNGIEMADPDLSPVGQPPTDGAEGATPFGDIDLSDPEVAAATEICGETLGGFGPGIGDRGAGPAGGRGGDGSRPAGNTGGDS